MQHKWRQILVDGLSQSSSLPLLTPMQIDLLIDYLALLHKWNKAYNLTSVRNPDEMIAVHLLDSLSIGPSIVGKQLIDVGTGPGLPGIPLAIAYPDKHFTLLDSNGKRVRFLFQVKNQLKLNNVTEVQERVELFQPNNRFDGVISRAFTSLSQMVEGCQHLVSAAGFYFAMKGKFPHDELEHLPSLVDVVNVQPLSVVGVDGERHLVVLKPRIQ